MKNIINKKVDIRIFAGVTIAMFMAIILAFQLPVSAANTFPAVYDLISVNNVDNKGVNSRAEVGGVSYDGSKVLFTTPATNLPSSNTTGTYAGYIRDVSTSTTKRVDVSTSGVAGDKMSFSYVMSTSGRYVAFVSFATNLIDGATLTSFQRAYVKDLQTNQVERITDVNLAGGNISLSSISDDGRFVGLSTNSVNSIIPGTRMGTNLNNYYDYLIYDRVKVVWTVVKGAGGVLPSSYLSVPKASCDGSLAVFTSNSNNLTNIYTGSEQHVFLIDFRNGMRIEDLTPGLTADVYSQVPNISCNGRYIVYTTKDRTIVSPPSGGINAAGQVVRFDRWTGERQYITNQGYSPSYSSDVAPASVTDAGDVVLSSGPANDLYKRKVYFKHLSDGSGTLESVHHVYQGLNYEPAFTPTYFASANGKYVVVSSKAAEYLGLLPASGNGTIISSDIIRVKTGL